MRTDRSLHAFPQQDAGTIVSQVNEKAHFIHRHPARDRHHRNDFLRQYRIQFRAACLDVPRSDSPADLCLRPCCGRAHVGGSRVPVLSLFNGGSIPTCNAEKIRERGRHRAYCPAASQEMGDTDIVRPCYRQHQLHHLEQLQTRLAGKSLSHCSMGGIVPGPGQDR